MSSALAFDNIATETLDTLFATFHDFVVYGDIITCFKPGKLFALR